MHSYFAVSTKLIKKGSSNQCVLWASDMIDSKTAKIIKIHKARPHDTNARIIIEVTQDGIRLTPNGRTVSLALLKSTKSNAT